MTVFPGAKARYTEDLSFLTPSSKTEGIPVYRVMDKKGDIIVPESDPNLPDEQLLKMYKVTCVKHRMVCSYKSIYKVKKPKSFDKIDLGND